MHIKVVLNTNVSNKFIFNNKEYYLHPENFLLHYCLLMNKH